MDLLRLYSSGEAANLFALEYFSRQSTRGCLGNVLDCLGIVFSRLGHVLRSWVGHLGQSSAVLEPSWGRLRWSWAVLCSPEPVFDCLGPS